MDHKMYTPGCNQIMGRQVYHDYLEETIVITYYM